MSSLLIPRTNFGTIWFDLLGRLYDVKTPIKPRNIPCYEITGVTIFLEHARNNILLNTTRDLNYRFMVAEWLYIWFGHDDVATIARYNKPITAFSDNGVDFNGAYGPPIRNQWPRILETLRKDPDSRQAVLLIYRIPTEPTRDVPCTLTLQFFNRDSHIDLVVCMRSSDIWLGLPYDVFNFTMLGNLLSAQLGLKLGSLTLHLGSSHLYETNRTLAKQIIEDGSIGSLSSPQLLTVPPASVDDVLIDPKTWNHGQDIIERPWYEYARLLSCKTRSEALGILRAIK